MNLDYAKELIKKELGKKLNFIYRGSRNQIEEFEGVIEKCYPSIFIIKTKDNIIKSFTYNDFIIKNLKIITKK